jgi:rubrerythrin
VNTVPYKPLKDLVTTYLPDEAMKPVQWRVVTCRRCGLHYKGMVGKPDGPCPICDLKDKFL